MNCFAALPGTQLINLDPDTPALPVVGWAACGGPKLLPLVVGRAGPLVAGDAVLAESGRVFDLVTGVVYEDEESWRDYTLGADDYRAGTTGLPAISFPAAAAPAAVVNMAAPTATPTSTKPVPTITGTKPNVDFSGKVYAKQSFWQAPPENPNVVFILEPGLEAPISGAEKITRDQFQALRRKLPEVTTAALTAGTDEAPNDEPADAAAAPEPEDEADDMI